LTKEKVVLQVIELTAPLLHQSIRRQVGWSIKTR